MTTYRICGIKKEMKNELCRFSYSYSHNKLAVGARTQKLDELA